MSKNVITEHNPVERVAFDMALALATKQNSIKTPEQLMAEIEVLYPECYEVAKKQWSKENPPPSKAFLDTF
ncbi:hypothetical protein CO695_10570 [Providencia alcalifaciens]|uniref:Uncharacterized protein n=2 Tax=Providencia alcalifaciens TaxID=126385 RepID=B6XCU6_9GAMM|nr:hypothetical protein [Providencia alcalifaciens]ATG16718.1 hypothetical protein CO695_10570 [Providencia alcalifaciens]EEB46844.1 hypothetical protein PROVALCAL_01162 [Providencia alcalifaciens DSM 30120]SQI39405.1 Uncharacterised protein [Providencia alcalifaciens]